VLAHARAGKLAFNSCCCFIGCFTADHPLQAWSNNFDVHYHYARKLPGALGAEQAFLEIGRNDDELRRRRIIPILRAELRRRELANREMALQLEAVVR